MTLEPIYVLCWLSQLISGHLWIFHVLVLTPDFSICSLALYIWDHYF